MALDPRAGSAHRVSRAHPTSSPWQSNRGRKKYTVKELQKASELLADIRAFVQDRPIASTAANYIREVQLRPFKRLPNKRRPASALPAGRVTKQLRPSASRTLAPASIGLAPNQPLHHESLAPRARGCTSSELGRNGAQMQACSGRPVVTGAGCGRVHDAPGSRRLSSDDGRTADSLSDTASAPPMMGPAGGRGPLAAVGGSDNVVSSGCGRAANTTEHTADGLGGKAHPQLVWRAFLITRRFLISSS